jgi:hypothetical protein
MMETQTATIDCAALDDSECRMHNHVTGVRMRSTNGIAKPGGDAPRTRVSSRPFVPSCASMLSSLANAFDANAILERERS